MYFFFTFPLWPILAMLVFAIVGAGVVVEWITNHILVISLIIWLITFIFATLLTAKGKKLCTISIVSLFIAPYIALISCFFDVVRALNKGDLFQLVIYLFGILGGILSALPVFGICLAEKKYLSSHSKWSVGLAIFNWGIAFLMSTLYYQVGFGNL